MVERLPGGSLINPHDLYDLQDDKDLLRSADSGAIGKTLWGLRGDDSISSTCDTARASSHRPVKRSLIIADRDEIRCHGPRIDVGANLSCRYVGGKTPL
jgi:hypothetical protein